MKLTKKLNIYLSHLPMPSGSLVCQFACSSSTDHSYLRSRIVHCPWRDVCRPLSQACPLATFLSLSTGHLPKLVHRLTTKACPRANHQGSSKGHPPMLIHRLPFRTCPKQPPSKVCLLQATYQGLSTGHFPSVVQRLHTRDCPQVT